MDQIEKDSGLDENNFWHKAKVDLINILISKIKKQDLNILVVGCGTGNDLDAICKYGRVVVCDINKKALNNISQNVIKKNMDVTNLGFKDNTFDLVLSFDVFEHIKDDTLAIRECHRVLKKGGHLILTVPAWQFLFSSYDKSLGHLRRYNCKQLLRKLTLFKKSYLSYWNSTLFLPFVVERTIKKFRKHSSYENTISPFINDIFFKILSFENYLIKKGFKLPPGMTLCGIFKAK